MHFFSCYVVLRGGLVSLGHFCELGRAERSFPTSLTLRSYFALDWVNIVNAFPFIHVATETAFCVQAHPLCVPGVHSTNTSSAAVTHGVVFLQDFSAADPHFTLTAAPLSLIFRIFERRMLPLYEAIGEKPCGSGPTATQEFEELFLISSLPGSTETTLPLPTRRSLRAGVEAIFRSFVLVLRFRLARKKPNAGRLISTCLSEGSRVPIRAEASPNKSHSQNRLVILKRESLVKFDVTPVWAVQEEPVADTSLIFSDPSLSETARVDKVTADFQP